MGDDLESRLKSHARAFEGLMSLIPAETYYGKDAAVTSEQWRKANTKQTKEERQAAKRAKLDPASHKTAQDVMDENARKRKRELEGDDSSDFDTGVEHEKPLEGLKRAAKAKKQKTDKEDVVEDEAEEADTDVPMDAVKSKAQATADKRREKRERKKEKQAKKLEQKEAEKARKAEFGTALGRPDNAEAQDAAEGQDEDDSQWEDEGGDDHIQDIDVSGIVDDQASTATPSSADSNASAPSVASAASSSSSVVPPPKADSAEKSKKNNRPPKPLDPKVHESFKSRLQLKLDALRAARKADGPDGRPARNRAELIEARRKKEAERKAARKASIQTAKEDEARAKAEAELARLRGSGSPNLFSRPLTPENEHNLAFGRVAWKDGEQLESTLSDFLKSGKKKGRSDPKTALEAAKKKHARLNGLDEQKRKDIQDKDLWLSAKKRAQGEKVHDDFNLLKKSVKRQDKAKAKSTQQWKDRMETVVKSKQAKQKKREENLQKRREEKGNKGKKKKGTKVSKPGKKARRAGFEGTMKGR